MFIRKPFHLYTQRGAIDPAPAPAGSWIAVYDGGAGVANNPGWSNYTLRNVIPLTNVPATYSKVRVTWAASTAVGIVADNVAIGKATGTASNTTGIIEVTRDGGSSGFNISAGGTKLSDEMTFAGTSSDTTFVAVIDVAAAGGGDMRQYSLTGANSYYSSNDNSYNENTPSPAMSGPSANQVVGVQKIEVFG